MRVGKQLLVKYSRAKERMRFIYVAIIPDNCCMSPEAVQQRLPLDMKVGYQCNNLHPIFITKKWMLYRKLGLFSLQFYLLSKHSKVNAEPSPQSEQQLVMMCFTCEQPASLSTGQLHASTSQSAWCWYWQAHCWTAGVSVSTYMYTVYNSTMHLCISCRSSTSLVGFYYITDIRSSSGCWSTHMGRWSIPKNVSAAL